MRLNSMKNACAILSMFVVSNAFAQSGYKYQLRLNVIPVKDFAYAGAGRIGVETVSWKYNIGLDLMTYQVDQMTKMAYRRDSVLRRTKSEIRIPAYGLAFSISRAYPFINNRNKWIFGAQVFSGVSRQIADVQREIFDTTFNPCYGPRWVNEKPVYTAPERHQHGRKFSFAVSLFARLQLDISKRFTFTPEFQLPFYVNNYIGGGMYSEVKPGFNFCLGYRFISDRPSAL